MSERATGDVKFKLQTFLVDNGGSYRLVYVSTARNCGPGTIVALQTAQSLLKANADLENQRPLGRNALQTNNS